MIWRNIAQTINKKDFKVPQGDFTQATFTDVLQLVFGLLGAIALLMVTIGGLKYVSSQGDPQATAKAKNTILYAIVGLVVAIAAFSIVTFVVQST